MTDEKNRKVMAIGIILIFLLFGFVKANDGNQTNVTDEGGSKRSTPTSLGFLGCYLGCGKFPVSMIRQDMMNPYCRTYCADNAQIYAATRGKFCGCTNTLADLKPLVEPEVKDAMSPPTGVTGVGSSCAKPCPGSAAATRKARDCGDVQCCGGDAAYTVYGTGQMPLEKQFSKRIMAAVSPSQMRRVTLERDTEVVPDIDDLIIKFIIKEVEHLKICTATTISLECEELPTESLVHGLTHLKLTVTSYSRDTRYTIPHDSQPVKDATDVAMDVGKARDADSKLVQTFTVSHSTSYSSVVTSGFSISAGIETAVNMGFAEATITAGFTGSLSFTEDNTESYTTANSIAVEVKIPRTATGATITLMKESSELSIAWKAETRVSGSVRLLLGGRSKDFLVQEILLTDEQTFITGGIMQYGERAKITALLKITGRDSAKTIEMPKPQLTSSKSVRNETGKEVNIDALVTGDQVVQAGAACGVAGFARLANKCGCAIELDFAKDKKVECETERRKKKEICSISCKETTTDHVYGYDGGKEKHTTENLWTGAGGRRMDRLNALLPHGKPYCVASENLAFNRFLLSQQCKEGNCACNANDGIKEGVALIAAGLFVDFARDATIYKIRMFILPQEDLRGVYLGVEFKFGYWSSSDYRGFLWWNSKHIDDGVWKINAGETNDFVDVHFKANKFIASVVYISKAKLESKITLQELEVWGYYTSERRCTKRNCCTSSKKCENDEGYCDNDNQCWSGNCGQPGSCHWAYDHNTRCCQVKYRCHGEDADCCTPDQPCIIGDGDCDHNDECVGSLVCGVDNCKSGTSGKFEIDDDCCEFP